jgi:hypothetical protein
VPSDCLQHGGSNPERQQPPRRFVSVVQSLRRDRQAAPELYQSQHHKKHSADEQHCDPVAGGHGDPVTGAENPELERDHDGACRYEPIAIVNSQMGARLRRPVNENNTVDRSMMIALTQVSRLPRLVSLRIRLSDRLFGERRFFQNPWKVEQTERGGERIAQATGHNFMWLRSHGYRRSGAPGATTAMKSADFDPHIVRITVAFGNPHRHLQVGHARRQFTFAQSSATASVVLLCLRSSVISAQRPLPSRSDLLGMAEAG